MSATLLVALAESLARLATDIDLTDDEEVDPDLATRWFEDLAYRLDQLSREDRSKLAEIVRQMAERESVPARRGALLEFPENLGLDQDDEP
ncbi:hypothetical protein LO771_25375 [Streptacidiphilus sp. ASG 303]|uniref:hypothetical protein n=1 Tax=Streptacidiphilus sp. ASG 303 TaxID=2896847 RepID=UPI001E377337|nr:hypothetical protein [Streptacidiphilus sp. ASG 303]MCD0485628.1 hypothetical protein [Streptacidiphilus sp. ASG 303]